MQLWTPAHVDTLLPALGVMLLIGLVLRLTIGNKSYKVRMIPIQIIACVLLILEVGKQTVSLQNGYDLYHLPFHFCSLFLFVLPAMAFYRGKHQSKVTCISAATCAALFLLMLIYPDLIYSQGNIEQYFTEYLSFHTVTFHNLVMLAFVLIAMLNLHTPAPKGEQRTLIAFVSAFCVISASMAHLLETNYANFYTCNIPALEAVRQSIQASLGYVLTQILYVLILTVLNILFVLMSYWFYRLLLRLMPARKSKQLV